MDQTLHTREKIIKLLNKNLEVAKNWMKYHADKIRTERDLRLGIGCTCDYSHIARSPLQITATWSSPRIFMAHFRWNKGLGKWRSALNYLTLWNYIQPSMSIVWKWRLENRFIPSWTFPPLTCTGRSNQSLNWFRIITRCFMKTEKSFWLNG